MVINGLIHDGIWGDDVSLMANCSEKDEHISLIILSLVSLVAFFARHFIHSFYLPWFPRYSGGVETATVVISRSAYSIDLNV
jgi:hypothetical protein